MISAEILRTFPDMLLTITSFTTILMQRLAVHRHRSTPPLTASRLQAEGV